jgi:ABC-type lipoprotein export system ATPase subunit
LKKGLTCEDLSFSRFDADGSEEVILDRINACFEAGQVTLISGPTGAGKSTLLHILGGLIRPTVGRVMADGAPVSQWMSIHRDQWRRKVGILFQQHHLLEELSVLENIMLPMIPRSLSISELRSSCYTILETLGLSPAAGVRPGRLSGGQRQQVALARALVSNPDFILADEPTAFQDDGRAEQILDLLKTRACRGATVVICSHDPRARRQTVFDVWFLVKNHRLIEASGHSDPMMRHEKANIGDKE